LTAPHADRLVGEYLGRLGSELEGVPESRREEILDEITNHIAEERGRLEDESDADLRNLLDRLGDPAEVAAAARGERSERARAGERRRVGAGERRRVGAVEVLALLLTPFFWPAGVILLWISPAWNRRDKLIGTLLPPGGYLPLLMLPAVLLADGFTSTCGGLVDTYGSASSSCAGFATLPVWQQDLEQAAVVAVVLILAVLPILTAIYLGRRLYKRR
jgi:hypothetical protein